MDEHVVDLISLCVDLICLFLQKTQSAVARLAELPLVRLACNQLSVLYSDTKHSHTHLKTVCEVLEKSVTALGSAACEKVSPVIVTLKPQSKYFSCVVSGCVHIVHKVCLECQWVLT